MRHRRHPMTAAVPTSASGAPPAPHRAAAVPDRSERLLHLICCLVKKRYAPGEGSARQGRGRSCSKCRRRSTAPRRSSSSSRTHRRRNSRRPSGRACLPRSTAAISSRLTRTRTRTQTSTRTSTTSRRRRLADRDRWRTAMPEYLHPGVYIEEIERGPRPIEGVPTSTAAFLGEAERGSITPRLVTSYKDYQRWFGDVFEPNKFLPYAVNGFFENGGKRAFICRLVGDGADSRRSARSATSSSARRARARGARASWSRSPTAPPRSRTAPASASACSWRTGARCPTAAVRSVRRIGRRLPRPPLDRGLRRSRDRRELAGLLRQAPPVHRSRQGRNEPGAGELGARRAGAQRRRRRPAPGPPTACQVLTRRRRRCRRRSASTTSTGCATAAAAIEQGLAALELDPYRESRSSTRPTSSHRHRASRSSRTASSMRFRFAVIDSRQGRRQRERARTRATRSPTAATRRSTTRGS